MAILWILYKCLELSQTNKCENPVLNFSQILCALKITNYTIYNMVILIIINIIVTLTTRDLHEK